MITSNKLSLFEDNIAVITPDNSKYSYAQIIEYRKIFSDKVEPRSLVFCLSENTIGSLVGYISFITSDIVPLIIDGELDKELLNNFIGTYQPNYIWAPEDSFINKYGDVVLNILGYSLIKFSKSMIHEIHDDLCLLLPTSGSTGSPKLVRLSYNNIYSNAHSISEYLSIDENEKPITLLPMYYSFGLSIINSHLIKGATILLTKNSLMEKKFWLFLKENEATSLSGVPYTFEMLKKIRFFNMELPTLKTITQAGGKLDDALNRDISEYCNKSGKFFFIMYGQTEASPRMGYLPHNQSINKIGSMGIAIPGGKFSLIDDNGDLINEDNKDGELVYEGKNVSMGYATSVNDLSAGDLNNGVLLTGDIARRDSEGYYFIIGRKKRFIKLFGFRVSLDMTEILLKNILSECACTGEDDKMIIYITEKEKIGEVKSFISKKIGINLKAFTVKYVSEIPKNSSGKIIYSKLIK